MKSETEKALVEMVRVAYRKMTGESPDDLVITICQRGRPNGTAFEINTTRVGRCLCCSRKLTDPDSVDRGLGPICVAKIKRIGLPLIDLPFDPKTMDIICRRDIHGAHFNIYHVFRHHSTTGMEWGYGGSGPADFALNIMALFLKDEGPRTVKLWDGKKVSQTVWNLHQKFKSSVLFGSLPKLGGTLKGDDIRAWISKNRGIK